VPLQVELVSPEEVLYEGEAQMVVARTVGGGDIAFLPGHTPFLGVLDTARVILRPESGDDKVIAVHGGFVEVSDDHVTILSEVAEMADDIDVDRARRARDDAQQAPDDDDEARGRLRRAETRLRTAGAED